MAKKIGFTAGFLIILIALLVIAFGRGWFGNQWGPGVIEGPEVAGAVIEERTQSRTSAARKLSASDAKQILSDHRDQLERVTQELLKKETLDAEQLRPLLGEPS